MKKRKMYLDIDGVVVVWDARKSCVELSRGFGQLMRFCKIYDIAPFWLTNWSGSRPHLEGIGRLLWPDICPTMAHPEIVDLGGRPKAYAVDYDSDFVWIEDGVSEEDVRVLREHGALDRLFWTDGEDSGCLLAFMKFAAKKMKLPSIRGWRTSWRPAISRPKPKRSRS